jgi:hypothetical protein
LEVPQQEKELTKSLGKEELTDACTSHVYEFCGQTGCEFSIQLFKVAAVQACLPRAEIIGCT